VSLVLEFAAAAGLLTLIPGPDTLLVLRSALAGSRAEAVAAAAGVCTALAGWGCAAGLGLAALLREWPGLFTALRYVGVAYLAYLGFRAFRTPAAPAEAAIPDRQRQPARFRRGYLRGVATNATNPKVGFFYLALFPQFIPAGASVLGHSMLLTSIQVAESMAWLTAVAVGATWLRGRLRRPGTDRWVGRLSGSAFLAFAVRLAWR
jgi:threonine/homoserine/homoserine lactone efflux protein